MNKEQWINSVLQTAEEIQKAEMKTVQYETIINKAQTTRIQKNTLSIAFKIAAALLVLFINTTTLLKISDYLRLLKDKPISEQVYYNYQRTNISYNY